MTERREQEHEGSVESSEEQHAFDRRGFFRGVAQIALGSVGGATLLGQLYPERALASDADVAPGGASTGATAELASQTQRVLRWAGPDPSDWVRSRGVTDHDVVIIGGGQSGLGLAYDLKRKGVGRVDIIDAAEAGQAGVWLTVGRMRQLNTSKDLLGPAQGNPALGFRAWYETLYGAAAFDKLERTPRLAWADYLAWFQQVTRAQIRYRTRLLDIEPEGEVLRLHLESEGVARTETTRKLVLATGYAGAGGVSIPSFLRALPPQVLTHTATPPPYEALSGKVVGILGAGASAFDAAATALESGAREVHLYSRKSFIDYTAPASRGRAAAGAPTADRGYASVTELLYELPDTVRWRNQLQRDRRLPSVTLDTIQRAVAFKNFHVYLNAPWTEVALTGKKVVAKVAGKRQHFDHVIAATGYFVDLSARPELARVLPSIALWRDHYQPEAGEEDAAAGLHPYLGAGFEFLPRPGAEANYLRNIHLYNIAARLSFGAAIGDVPSSVYHARVVSAIARDLFQVNIDVAAHQRFINVPQTAPDPGPYQSAVSQI
jgi:FAD-dependent urate hydroxylase